ncbi:aldo/keto reductase [Streptosporangium sp. NPDC050855]|uniref:aldo/keto reductase n=1 Tax=Streptosporangium sp. NPDC050855 TaxID=3366194 RepID=UPI0037A2D63E
MSLPELIRTGAQAYAQGSPAELREAGLVRHLGLSNATPAHLAEARSIAPVVCVQNPYGIGLRPDGLVRPRTCAEQGIAFVPFFAIAGIGQEAGASGADSEEVTAVARTHRATAAQVRLAWTLQQGPNVLAIPGTGNPDRLADNVAAGALRLSPQEPARLDSAHRTGA